MITLRGLSWDDPRGMGPLLGTLPAYRAQRPDVAVRWVARSLDEFGDRPLEQLVDAFDILIIDHPFVGSASARRLLVPIDELVPADLLAGMGGTFIGPSHESYGFDGHLWALAIDAACQVSAHRPDVFAALDLSPPATWSGALALASRLRDLGRPMGVPLNATDVVPALYSIAASIGCPPFTSPERVLDSGCRAEVLGLLRRLHDLADPATVGLTPPELLDAMARDGGPVYSPMLFGYSNYARPGFRPKTIGFADLPTRTGAPGGSCLGGAGFAISRRCRNVAEATAYGIWLTGSAVQQGAYLRHGGQPAHRSAWVDPAADACAGGFFGCTLASMEGAFLRPRFDGYPAFQHEAGRILTAWLDDPLADDAAVGAALDVALARGPVGASSGGEAAP